jgi:hypothetical protein
MGSSGVGGRPGGERRPEEEMDCPRRLSTIVIDIPQTGNARYAFSLDPGTRLSVNITPDSSGVALLHDGKVIGYLPPQYADIAGCISLGWKYSSSIVRIEGTEESPRVEVLVIGAPP